MDADDELTAWYEAQVPPVLYRPRPHQCPPDVPPCPECQEREEEEAFREFYDQ